MLCTDMHNMCIREAEAVTVQALQHRPCAGTVLYDRECGIMAGACHDTLHGTVKVALVQLALPSYGSRLTASALQIVHHLLNTEPPSNLSPSIHLKSLLVLPTTVPL